MAVGLNVLLMTNVLLELPHLHLQWQPTGNVLEVVLFSHICYLQLFASLETEAPILAQHLLCLVSLLRNGVNLKIPTDSK